MLAAPPMFSGPLGGVALPQGLPVTGVVQNLSLYSPVSADPSVAPGRAAGVGTVAINGTYTWIKYGTGNTDWWRVQNVSAGGSTRDVLLARAMEYLGTSPLYSWFEDFDGSTPAWERQPGTNGGQVALLGPGVVPFWVPEHAGVMYVKAGTAPSPGPCTAADASYLEYGDATNGRPGIFPGFLTAASALWYFAARIHINAGLMNTNESYGIQWVDDTGAVQMFMGQNAWGGASWSSNLGSWLGTGPGSGTSTNLHGGSTGAPAVGWKIWEAWAVLNAAGTASDTYLRILNDDFSIQSTSTPGTAIFFPQGRSHHPRVVANPDGSDLGGWIAADWIFAAYPDIRRYTL